MFEYRIEPADGVVSVDTLNVLGQDGWELVSIIPFNEGYDYIFKKRILQNNPFGIPMNIKSAESGEAFRKTPDIKRLVEIFNNGNKI